MVLALSAWLTCVSFFSLRMRRAGLVPSRWRLPECMRTILPFAVILKRFFAPRWVFSFIFGFSELRGIALHPLDAMFPKFANALCARLRLGAAARSSACAFFRRQQRHQDVTFHARRRLDLPEIANLAEQPRHLGPPDFLV